MEDSLSEPESHSHRTDQEWRALVRGWKERLEMGRNNSFAIAGVVEEMERESR